MISCYIRKKPIKFLKIYNKVVGNDKKMSEHNEVYDPEKFKLNPDYEHVLENPI